MRSIACSVLYVNWYNNHYWFDHNVYLDDYANFNAKTRYQLTNQAELFFILNNLTGQHYRTYST